jgi:hypothetical protein
MFILIAMCSYYLSQYFNNLFKIKKEKRKLIPLILTNISILFLSIKVFINATAGLKFLHGGFKLIFTSSMFLVLIAVFYFDNIKKEKTKLINQ